MSSPTVLPELIRCDLNDDGSVTLLLTHPSCKIGILSFGVGNTNRPYRLAQLGATLPVEGEVESIDFRLVDAEGALFIVKARTENAMGIFGRIHSHINKADPKLDAAFIPYVLQKAA
jgi:hypothetical protein